jgi:hypothetical protein
LEIAHTPGAVRSGIGPGGEPGDVFEDAAETVNAQAGVRRQLIEIGHGFRVIDEAADFRNLGCMLLGQRRNPACSASSRVVWNCTFSGLAGRAAHEGRQ